MRFGIPLEERIEPGNLGCQGCGGALSMRMVLKGLSDDTVAVIPACCWSIIDGPWPVHALQVPVFHTAFETAAIMATGIKAAKLQQGKDTTVMAWAGDGGTFDIGLQALSGAAERNEDIIYVCYDNEAYMNTGIQRSSSTPIGTWTTTTPDERPETRPKKNIMEIMAAHRIPYAATATPAYPDDLLAKVEIARDLRGTRFLHILSACPPGWKMGSGDAIAAMRAAVDSRVFPLYEVRDGLDVTITRWPEHEVDPEAYFAMQGRFRPLLDDPEELARVRRLIDRQWETLVARHREHHPEPAAG
ncbi:MAG: pyruvate synthase subunit beta [Actinobacteria bacterium]|nr:pyruvate synthase subunit beta [Actinomycetota bacterium]